MNKPIEPSEIAMDISRWLLTEFDIEYFDEPIDEYIPASRECVARAIDYAVSRRGRLAIVDGKCDCG